MVKKNVRLDSVNSGEVTRFLHQQLSEKGYEVVVESTSDHLIHLTVGLGFNKTTVRINRYSHRPLVAEVDVDYLYLLEVEKGLKYLVRERKREGRNVGMRGYFMFWIALYAFFFLFTLIASTLGAFVNWLSEPRNLISFVSVFIAVSVFLLVVVPILRARRVRELAKFDRFVIQDVVQVLETLQESSEKTIRIVRCWNCFEEVRSNQTFCENCGEAQKLT